MDDIVQMPLKSEKELQKEQQEVQNARQKLQNELEKINIKSGDYTVHVHIIEGKQRRFLIG